MKRMGQAIPLEDILEDAWDAQLFRGPKALANMLGWTTYHVLRSRGSRAGYPDRTCVRERIVFAELKREKTKPTPDQIEWLDKLASAGGEVYLWRPSDLDEIGTLLGKRWHFDPGSASLISTSTTEQFWPQSLWLPHVGRRDGGRVPSEQVSLLPNL